MTGPSIDFVVPCGRPHSAAAATCLRTLSASLLEGARIIVVGPTLDALRRQFPGEAFVWDETPTLLWPAANRNRGAAHARADLVVFVDDDCILDPDAPATIARCFATDPGLGALTGRATSVSGRYWARVYDLALFGPTHGDHPVTDTEHFACVVAVRRTVHAEVGGFDETLRAGEDCDYAARIIRAGHRTLYEPALRIAHDHRRDRPGVVLAHNFWAGRQALAYERKRFRQAGAGWGRDRLRLLLRPIHPLLLPLILARTIVRLFLWNRDRPVYFLRHLPGLLLSACAFEAGRYVVWGARLRMGENIR